MVHGRIFWVEPQGSTVRTERLGEGDLLRIGCLGQIFRLSVSIGQHGAHVAVSLIHEEADRVGSIRKRWLILSGDGAFHGHKLPRTKKLRDRRKRSGLSRRDLRKQEDTRDKQ